jgi:hypothetical protein
MDPATALGIASSIVQLVSFSSDLISKGNEIYKSVDGALSDNVELATIAASLQELSSELPLTFFNNPKRQLSKTEKQMQDLCQGCRKLSTQLLDAVKPLKISGSSTRWKSFRQALLTVWQEPQIIALEIRLERYRRQLETVLLISLKESIESISEGINKHERVSSHVLGKNPTNEWKAELIDSLYRENWQSMREEDLANFSAKFSAGSKQEKEVFDQLRILEKLRFRNMEDRAEGIAAAHANTFNWISIDEKAAAHACGDLAKFGTSNKNEVSKSGDIPWDNFVKWLEGDSALYWITGKPGSCKSTLMKYLHNNPRIPALLQHWSSELPLTIAGFFFWNSGTEMQMSELGLLQTLLHCAIGEDCKLIPTLFPERWRSYMLLGGSLHPWSMSELLRAFNILISDSSRAFFFLVDGLDEFDGEGAELADFIQDAVSSRANVKICVASRPWLVFEDAFQKLPSLRIEVLTSADINLFVTDKLCGNRMFLELQKVQPQEAECLISEVTEKASGVFLWVRLVVTSLLEGLRDGDSIQDLQERLLELPSDLERLFSKILDQLNPAYFRQVSIYFQLVGAARDPLSLLEFSLAEEEFQRTTSFQIQPMSSQEVSFRTEAMRRRLSSRCKGLLEVTRSSENGRSIVQYLHRTVKDYLHRADIWRHIILGAEPFNPDLILAGTFLHSLKVMTLPPCTPESSWEWHTFKNFWAYFDLCVHHSLSLESTDTQLEFIDELKQTGDTLFACKISSGFHWAATSFGLQDLARVDLYGSSFFGLAVKYRLHSYVQREVVGGQLNSFIGDKINISVLYDAAIYEDIIMLKILLDAGGDPNRYNFDYPRSTAWVSVLKGIIEARDKLDYWAQVAGLFLDHGADPYARVLVSDDSVTVADLIERKFGDWDPSKTRELLEKVEAAKNICKKSDKRRNLRTFWCF